MDSFLCNVRHNVLVYDKCKAVKSAKEQKNFAPFERTEI